MLNNVRQIVRDGKIEKCNETLIVKKCKNSDKNNSKHNKNAKNNKIIAKNIKNHNDENAAEIMSWTKALFTVYPSLPNIVRVIDNIVESRASSLVLPGSIYSSSSSTMMEIEKVIDMSERKNKILNIVALVREILSGLNDLEYETINLKFFKRMKTQSIASKLNIDERSVFRRIKKALEKSVESVNLLGYTKQSIERLVDGESWIREIYKKSKNELESNKVRAERNQKKNPA